MILYDLGVRNSLIQSFASLSVRNDIGALWENFCIVEHRKLLHYQRQFVNQYFWRTYDQKEIDYLEKSDGQLRGYEFKWSPAGRTKDVAEFLEAYPNR